MQTFPIYPLWYSPINDCHCVSNGLFEVMDNEEVAQDLLKMRYGGNMKTSDAAKKSVKWALKKGTSKNVGDVHHVPRRLLTTKYINDKSKS